MAIQLYRKGDTHEVNGIKCELQNFKIGQLDAQLKAGWFKSPEDIDNGLPEIEKNEESSEEIPSEEKEINPVRLAAKEAGIEGWDTKRIKTLEKMLNDNKD